MGIEEAIQAELDEVERTCNVRVLLAVEAGSRSIGTASADSDYDVRFVYVRQLSDYVYLGRLYGDFEDTIEWKLEGEYDIVGWDVSKFLALMRKSNPSVFEWLSSPVVYREAPEFQEVRAFAPSCYSGKSSAYHYLAKADHDLKYLARSEAPQLKTYIQLVHALLSARWALSCGMPATYELSALAERELEPSLRPVVEAAVERKVRRTDKDQPVRILELDEWALLAKEQVAERAKAEPAVKPVEWDVVDDVFFKILRRDRQW